MGDVRRLGSIVVLSVLALVLAGCGLKPEPTGVDAAFPAQAVDAAGTRINLTAAPDRIVSLDPGASAVLRAIGLEAVLVEAAPSDAANLAANPATDLVVVPLALGADAAARIDAGTEAPLYRYGAAPLDTAPTAITQLGLADRKSVV